MREGGFPNPDVTERRQRTEPGMGAGTGMQHRPVSRMEPSGDPERGGLGGGGGNRKRSCRVESGARRFGKRIRAHGDPKQESPTR